MASPMYRSTGSSPTSRGQCPGLATSSADGEEQSLLQLRRELDAQRAQHMLALQNVSTVLEQTRDGDQPDASFVEQVRDFVSKSREVMDLELSVIDVSERVSQRVQEENLILQQEVERMSLENDFMKDELNYVKAKLVRSVEAVAVLEVAAQHRHFKDDVLKPMEEEESSYNYERYKAKHGSGSLHFLSDLEDDLQQHSAPSGCPGAATSLQTSPTRRAMSAQAVSLGAGGVGSSGAVGSAPRGVPLHDFGNSMWQSEDFPSRTVSSGSSPSLSGTPRPVFNSTPKTPDCPAAARPASPCSRTGSYKTTPSVARSRSVSSKRIPASGPYVSSAHSWAGRTQRPQRPGQGASAASCPASALRGQRPLTAPSASRSATPPFTPFTSSAFTASEFSSPCFRTDTINTSSMSSTSGIPSFSGSPTASPDVTSAHSFPGGSRRPPKTKTWLSPSSCPASALRAQQPFAPPAASSTTLPSSRSSCPSARSAASPQGNEVCVVEEYRLIRVNCDPLTGGDLFPNFG